MNLERWLRNSKKWVEGNGIPLERWLEETRRQLKPESFSKEIADRSEEFHHQLSEWGKEVSERFFNSRTSSGSLILIQGFEELQEFGTRLKEEWSRMANFLRLGEHYRDAINTLVNLYIRNRFEQLNESLEDSGDNADVCHKPSPTDRHKRNAEELAELCKRQGGAWIKAAQFLSTQGDWLRDEYREPLAELQDQAPAIPWETVKEVLQESFGSDWPNRFQSIDSEPVATASLAQVHRAVLPNGDIVALKVQLPGAPKRIETDLKFFAIAARLLKDQLPGLDTQQVVRALSRSILLELDYAHEAENLTRFWHRYESRNWLIPKLLPELLTTRTLGMRFIEGTPLRIFLAEVPSAAPAVLKTLVSSFIHQIFLSGLFHADPHPGNFFVTPKGKIALLDFGAVSELTSRETEDYRNILAALLMHQAEGFLGKLEQAGFKVAQPEYLVQKLFQKYHWDEEQLSRNPNQEKEVTSLNLEYQLRIMREAGVEVPDSFVLMARVLISLGGLLNQHNVLLTPLDWKGMLMQQK